MTREEIAEALTAELGWEGVDEIVVVGVFAAPMLQVTGRTGPGGENMVQLCVDRQACKERASALASRVGEVLAGFVAGDPALGVTMRDDAVVVEGGEGDESM